MHFRQLREEAILSNSRIEARVAELHAFKNDSHDFVFCSILTEVRFTL